MIAEPPFEAGAVQDTTEEPLAFDEAVTEVGAAGGPRGLADELAAELAPDPAPFDAVTVKV